MTTTACTPVTPLGRRPDSSHRAIESNPLLRLWPGLALSASIAATGMALGRIGWLQDHGFSALTLAIVLGMWLGNTLYPLSPRFAALLIRKHLT